MSTTLKKLDENFTRKLILDLEEVNTSIGIGTAEPFRYLLPILSITDTPFVEYDLQKRINPKLINPNAKSIIAIAISYNKKLINNNKSTISTSNNRVNLSIGSIGIDYHEIITQKLQFIKNYLIQNYPIEALKNTSIQNNIQADIFVDTGPLVDREVAVRCGLGVIGKSGNLINKKLGSIIYIGYIITNIDLYPTGIIHENYCGNCDSCIKACPSSSIPNISSTSNISSHNIFNYTTCISYLTQKKELNYQERFLIKKQLYGCDICQLVCPYNKGVYCEEFEYDLYLDKFYPSIESIFSMSNKQFKDTYKNQACGWRGKKILQRNAIIGLVNSSYLNSNNNNQELLSLLDILQNDTRPDIQEYISWAKNILKIS